MPLSSRFARLSHAGLALALSGPLLAATCTSLTPAAAAQSLVADDAGSAPAAAPKAPVLFDVRSIDKTVDPCTDFYQYACGNWIRNNPIPASESRWTSFNEVADRNTYLLWQELTAAAAAPKTPLQTKYGNFYAACMNTEAVNALGAKPIEPELARIAALKDRRDVAALTVALERESGMQLFVRLDVEQDQKDSAKQILQMEQGGLSLPDRDYYLSAEPRMAALREQYVAHVTRMFVLLGDTEQQAAAEAASVMKIETALAQGSLSRVAMRDPAAIYHVMTVAQTQAMSPDFDWHTLLAGEGVAAAPSLNVSSPGYLKAVEAEIAAEPLPALKSYARWHTLHAAAPWLSKPFEQENFTFFAQALSGQKEQTPRWKRCTRSTDSSLGEAVGQDWVKQNFPPEAKANMEKLVAALKHALDEDIQSLTWMSPETKQQAELKLAAFRNKIGYPTTWRDYSTLTIKRDDLLGNEERSQIFEHKRALAKLGKPVDETEWGMTPPTVNAYYNPPQNDINFPAGILQPPFYDLRKDPAVNFGGIGVVIGHEMTHGFDDEGSKFGPTGNVKYNADGSLGSWFTPEDEAKFNQRTQCVADEYSKFPVAEGQNLNGKLTLGENTADNGGIRIAYQALQEVLARQGTSPTAGNVDGFTPDQRFFLAFGQVWCSNQTEQSARRLARTDPHSTGQWRTNGTVQNFDAFGKAFGCKVGAPMMPEKSCRIW